MAFSTHSASDGDRWRIYDAFLISLLWISICWILFLSDDILEWHLKKSGLHPREIQGLLGVFTMAFLHSTWEHLTQNTLAILVLNSILFYFYRGIALRIWIISLLLSHALLWLVGRDGNHIGASALLYAEFGFLIVSGFIRNNPTLMRASLVVVLYYGSLVWYVFPIDQHISWEGHASGFIIGTLLALVYRKKGPQRKIYQYELEPELPDDENAYWKIRDDSNDRNTINP